MVYAGRMYKRKIWLSNWTPDRVIDHVVASRRLTDGNGGAIPRRVGEIVDDRKSPYVPLPKDIEKQKLFARQSITIRLHCVLSRSNQVCI